MAPHNKPGPKCQTRGHDPVDRGTSCRQASPKPGPVGKDDSHHSWTEAISSEWNSVVTTVGSWGHSAAGEGKSILLSIIDLLPAKPDSPYSTALLKHYVEGSGEAYELKDIPQVWQDWIVKTTHGSPGLHKSLSPYNSGIYDLRNSLGHFDVTVKVNADKSKTYVISDVYEFGFTKHDVHQRGRHGFPLGNLSGWEINAIRRLLPSGEYRNPGGFKEKWEVRKDGKETILFIPQQFLAEEGKPFAVSGSFTVSATHAASAGHK